MAKTAPTASEIRAANRNAVGGGPKRCRKGKNCSATCIDQGKDCLVGLPEPASVATTKVAKMLQSKQGGGGSAPAAAAAPTPMKAAPTVEELSKRVTETGKVWARMQGTPQGAAAKAEFEKAKQDLQKAKDAEAAAKSAKRPSLLEGLKQAANPKSARGLTPQQDEEIGDAARRTNDRLNRKLNERQYYDDATNARIKAQNEKVVAPYQKLNEDEKAALALYGQNGVKYYQQVNQMLRSGQMEGSTPDKVKMAEFISGNLRSGLEKLPPTEVNELRRAVSGNVVGSLGKLKVGDVIEDKGFGSYTTEGKARTLDQFLKQDQPNAIIRVVSPKGARLVAPVMEYNTEDEHIMLPGSKFRLVEVNEKGAYSRKVGYSPMYTFEEVTE
jgi:hypothetical protein